MEGTLIELIALLTLHMSQCESVEARRALKLAQELRDRLDVFNAGIVGDPELRAFWGRWEKAVQAGEDDEVHIRAYRLIQERRMMPLFGRCDKPIEGGDWKQWEQDVVQWLCIMRGLDI